jgi:hypothetical protein
LSEEVVLKQEAGVKQHNSESPPSVGLRAGAFAEVGTLILTNKRLVYVSKGGASRAAAWALGGALTARALEKSVSQAEVDDLMKYEGSYFTPLLEITFVEAGRKMGGAYIRVDNRTLGQKPVHSFVFGSGFSKNEDWVVAINSAIAAARSNQANPSTTVVVGQPQVANSLQTICPRCGVAATSDAKFCPSCGSSFAHPEQTSFPSPPPPPPPPTTPTCPYCNGPIRYIQQYQRWYCDQDKKYL